MKNVNVRAFIERKDIIQSLEYFIMARSKKVFNVGINDFDGSCSYRDDNDKQHFYKFYETWKAMIQRGYSEKFHKKYPTYIGCSVDPKWHSLSNFKEWYDDTYVEGYHLDKDLLITGNKEYSPANCCWIPNELNQFLTNKQSDQGVYPTGVSSASNTTKLQAQIRINNKVKYLGLFTTPEAAHLAYAQAKQQHLITLLQRYASQLDERVVLRLSEMISMSVEDFQKEFC